MSFVVVIPARYQSTRLPGKPLLEIEGKPMLQHVVERARQSSAHNVLVATDNSRIEQFCRFMGYPVHMTSEQHQSGTDRIEEVCRQLGLANDDIVVNVQGDEPMIPPAVIDQVARNLQSQPEAGICTLSEPMDSIRQVLDPNAVKVVCDQRNMALYFSRAPVPFPRDAAASAGGSLEKADPGLYQRHIGIYAYRVRVLHDFVTWPQGRLEQIEKLEQLRAMEQGIHIHVEQSCEPVPAGIDTPADLDSLRLLLAGRSRA